MDRVSIFGATLLLVVGCGSSDAAPGDGGTLRGDAATGEAASCGSLCALIATSTCLDKLSTDDVDLCIANCELSHGDSVPACEPSWNALVACLSTATSQCTLQGACDAEDEKFSTCVDAQNPCPSSGGAAATGVQRDDFAIDIRGLRCGCPPALRSAGTTPACTMAAECPEHCCGCSATQAGSAVAACLGGQCADMATACASAVDEFGATAGAACP